MGQRIGAVEANLHASNGIVTARGDARGPSGNAGLDGRIDFVTNRALSNPNFRFTLAARHLNLAGILGVKTISHTDINFAATAEGSGLTAQALRSTFSLKSSRSTAGTFLLEKARIETRIANEQMIIANAQGSVAAVAFDLRGRIGIARPFATSLNYRIESTHLKQALTLAKLAGDGDLTMSGRVNGVVAGKNGADLRVIGTAKANDLSVQQFSTHQLSTDYDFAGVGHSIPSGKLAASAGEVRSGIDWRNVKVTVNIARAKPARVIIFAAAQDERGNSDKAVANLTVSGGSIDGTLTQATIAFEQRQWELSGPAHFWKNQNSAGVRQFVMRNGDSSLMADGSIASSGLQNLKMSVRSIDAGLVTALALDAGKFAGTISADAAISGTAAVPLIDLKVTAAKLAINGNRVGDLSVTGKLRAGEAMIDASVQQDASHSVSLKGSVPMALQWAKGFSVAFHDGMALRLNTPGLRAAPIGAVVPGTIQGVVGTIVANVDLSGTPFNPC